MSTRKRKRTWQDANVNHPPVFRSGFTFTSWYLYPEVLTATPFCQVATTEGSFVYHACGTGGVDGLRTEPVGSKTTTSLSSWTSIDPESWVRENGSWVNPKTYLTITITTIVPRTAFTMAPIIQLVWKPSDLSAPVTSATSATAPSATSVATPNEPLAKATLAGIAVGAVTFASFIVLAIFFYVRRSHRRRAAVVSDFENESTNPGANETQDSAKRAGLEPGEKPELDATAVAKGAGQPMEKQELPADDISPLEPVAFELDAGPPLLPELPGTQEMAGVGPPTQGKLLLVPGEQAVQSAPRPVSPLSGRSTPRPTHGFSSPAVMSSVEGPMDIWREGGESQ